MQSKDADREAAMEQLHSLLSHSGRGGLLSSLCGFLGKGRVKEMRDFVSRKHPASLGLVPKE